MPTLTTEERGAAERYSEPVRSASRRDWTARETEILTVALRLLQQHGYHRLTVQAVADQAAASKATLYRRWPSKADLVLAAFTVGTRMSAVPPRTGSLRGDLMAVGVLLCQQATDHASTFRALLPETSIGADLLTAMRDEFIRPRRALITKVLANAVDRGEISAAEINPEVCDLLPGYLVFRSVVSGRPPTDQTVRALVDELLMPSLRRDRNC